MSRIAETTTWLDRAAAVDWDHVAAELDEYGCGLTGPLLTPSETADIARLYADGSRFRSTIDMARYRFGAGEYRYFREPFPAAVTGLRDALYPRLLPIARAWWARLGRDTPWPDGLDEWLRMCHAAGQTKPTPILLKYGAGDWNALHRDLYGELVFPLQVVINLSAPGADHTGGEFLVYEQRPRAQSRATATLIPHGHGLVFTTRDQMSRIASGASFGSSREHPLPAAQRRASRRRVPGWQLCGFGDLGLHRLAASDATMMHLGRWRGVHHCCAC